MHLFFGIPTASLTAISRLARLTGAAIVPIQFYRRADQQGYDIILSPALSHFPSEDLTADATRLNACLEAAIRHTPQQYIWQYKRFKTRPQEGEKRFYDPLTLPCPNASSFAKRFRSLLPIVIDLETSGLNPQVNAILEMAAVTLALDDKGKLHPAKTYAYQVEPFKGARLDADALELTGIDPTYPLRYAIPERQALHRLFRVTKKLLAEAGCQRAILVGHNAWFDLSFIQAAFKRSQLEDNPFHSFTSFDTATLAGIVFGETVLARAARCA